MSNADIEERLDRLERIFALQSTTHDKRAVRYIRVSTGTQSHEYQLKLTERFINNRKWQLQKTYEDIGVSGKTTNRPGLKSL
ncbi:MAG: recombinase family protein, partial [Candidatus Hermodarchaeia archaeon]